MMKGKWTAARNDGGAYLCLDGMEIAHVGNMWSSYLANKGIHLNGLKRAKWLCKILNQKTMGEDKSNED